MRAGDSNSATLPIAHVALRILIILNWASGVLIGVLLVAMPTRRWIMTSMHLSPGVEAERVIWGLYAVAVIGLISIPLHYAVLKRLLDMVESVREGNPFIAANAVRLHGIAWALLGIQVLSIAVGLITRAISTPEHPLHFRAGFSVSGWLAVLMTFLLAQVFTIGTHMRDELEGVV